MKMKSCRALLAGAAQLHMQHLKRPKSVTDASQRRLMRLITKAKQTCK